MIKQLLCNHDYAVEKTIQSPSRMETYASSGGDPANVFFADVNLMCEKKFVIIQKCKKCQKSLITTVKT